VGFLLRKLGTDSDLREAMTTHTIRLRRPWEKTQVGSDVVIRVDVPETRADETDNESTYLYSRRFNIPTGLDGSSRVRLRISGWSGRLDSISLNGHALQPDQQSVNVDVTKLLNSQNRIDVQLSGTADASATLSGEVDLAIT